MVQKIQIAWGEQSPASRHLVGYGWGADA